MGYAAMLLYESLYLSAFGWRIGQPLRLRAVLEQMRQIGVDALPIVCLLAFTVGIMLGIQFVSALGEFGAQSQVVIAVAKSVRLALSGELVPDAVNVQGGVIAEDVRPGIPLMEKLGQQPRDSA